MESTPSRALDLPRSRGRRAALVALALMYMAAGANHFVNPDFYLHIMPPFIPAPEVMVDASGAAEIALGVGVLLPATRRWSGWGIVAMLIVFLVVHVDMIVRHDAFPEAPLLVLVLRIPLQLLFMYWAEWATRPDGPAGARGTP